MKTKTLLLGAVIALMMYSCSTDRDETNVNTATEKQGLKAEQVNINQPEVSRTGDTILIKTTVLDGDEGLDPIDPNTDPNEGGDPKNVPFPPKK